MLFKALIRIWEGLLKRGLCEGNRSKSETIVSFTEVSTTGLK